MIGSSNFKKIGSVKAVNYAIDNGYSGDKFAYRNDKGDLVYGKTKSAIAEAPIDTEDAPLFEGKRYYLGDMALMADTTDIKNVIDYKEHEYYLPLSIYNSFETNNIDTDSIEKLIIGISLSQKNYVKDFMKRISKFQVNDKKYSFQDKVVILAQGAAAKYAIDHFHYPDNSESADYAICDIGMLSIDNATVIKGKIRYENASGTTHDGIIRIITELQGYIAQHHDDMLSSKEVQEFLLKGEYESFGEKHDLREIIDGFKRDYTIFIAQKLLQTQKNILKKFPKIYFIGGGSYYLDKDLLVRELKVNADKIVIPKDAEYYNVLGYLFFNELPKN